MKHTWKKTTAFIMAMALVAGFAPANVGGFMTGGTAIVASAAEAEPTDPEKFVYDGVTYYNVHVNDYNSDIALYTDMLFTKSNELGGYSIADLWAMVAAGKATFPECASNLKNNIDKNINVGKPYWSDYNGIAYEVMYSSTWRFKVVFKDFKITPMLPDNDTSGNYIQSTYTNNTALGTPVSTSGIKNSSSQPQTINVKKSVTKSYSVSSTTQKKVNAEIGATVEIGTKAKAGIVEATEKASFSMKVATEAMWSNSKQESDTVNASEEIALTAPPHTEILMSESNSDVTMKTRYNCPLALSYSVEIYDMDPSLVDHWYCSFGKGGVGAREDLVSRASAGVALGNTDKDHFDWKNKVMTNSITKYAYQMIANHVPMSTVGVTFTENCETKTHTFYDYEPLYPLSYIKPDVTAISMKIGDNQYTDSLGLKGYNTKDVDYYGFSQRNGYWIATDKSGNALTPENSPIKLTEVTINGKKMYVAANEMPGGAKITAVKPGECQLRYMIDEGRYTSVATQNIYSTNESIGDRTAIIDVTVKEDENTAKKPKITAKYSPEELAGKFGREHYDLDDYFDVDFKDSTGRDVDYIWEAQERTKKGIAFDENNSVYFTKNGVFHVRVRDPESGIYSDWIEITGILQAGDEDPYEITEPDEPIVDADENTSFVIRGSYTGLVGAEPDMLEGEPAIELYDENDEQVYTHGRLQFDAYDKSNKEMNIAYSWEAQETEGITLTEDGKVSFTSPGTYHIRAKSGEYASNWYVINAKSTSEEYSTVWFLDADGTLIKAFFQPWGSVVNAPDDPEMEGYIFKGWSADIPETMPADSLELYAQWEIDDSAERVLIKGNVRGAGQLAVSENGEEPVFDEAYPITSLNNNTVKGESLIFSAKPDDGWKFIEWQDRATGEVYSKDATITITADVPLDLIAVFDAEDSAEYVLISGNVRGAGHLAVSENGDAPVFDEDHPATSLYNNVVKGDTLIYSAKADEGWVFKEWQHKATGEVYSKDATITITADTPLDLVAVFDTEDAVTEHKLTDAEMMQWTAKDYKDKTGTDANVAITGWSDDEYEITITDDDKVLDTYKINPDTGIGTNKAGEEVNLPQTGMSGAHKALAGLAALMTLTGIALVKKSRKKEEN